MQNYSIEILNPKAFRLLQDMVELELISMKKEKINQDKINVLKEVLLNGPTWTEGEYKEYLNRREAINAIGKR